MQNRQTKKRRGAPHRRADGLAIYFPANGSNAAARCEVRVFRKHPSRIKNRKCFRGRDQPWLAAPTLKEACILTQSCAGTQPRTLTKRKPPRKSYQSLSVGSTMCVSIFQRSSSVTMMAASIGCLIAKRTNCYPSTNLTRLQITYVPQEQTLSPPIFSTTASLEQPMFCICESRHVKSAAR